MKRILCLIFVVLLLCGCSSTKSKVTTPLTWDDINAIPVATSDMTEEQLRQIVLDYFRLQLTFQWSPKESFAYSITTYKKPRSFDKQTVYAGLPYQGSKPLGANLYWLMELYDPETGILDNSGMDGQEFSELMGNHCTSSPYWAWARVVNSTPNYNNLCMTKHYGFLPVGDYEYNTVQWAEETPTKAVCIENGEQRMYEAYALLEPADGIYMFISLGGNSHLRMVSSYPVVVRNEDGTINGEASYLLFMDQGSSLKDYVAEDGSTVQLQGKVDEKATFADLFKKSYLPFTFGEFTGSDPVEKAEVTAPMPEKASVRDIINCGITSNYPIVYIDFILKDKAGKTVYEEKNHAGGWNVYEAFLAKTVSLENIRSQLEMGELQMSLQVFVSTGELITAYEGTLTNN
ncbi:MAG: hypothetical protein IKU07_05020 [Oscillospiraceae bacterium]|nr:hypothetical protein [Oscillospiraceae bacterium]